MNNFERTKQKSERDNQAMIYNQTVKLCKEEIYSSATHQGTSMDKIVESLDLESNTELSKKLKEHIDNVYYHMGKIQAASTFI